MQHRSACTSRPPAAPRSRAAITGPRSAAPREIDGFEIDVPVSEHAPPALHRPPGHRGCGPAAGEAGINIAGMQVSRDEAGGQALIALTVDSAIPADVLAAMAE